MTDTNLLSTNTWFYNKYIKNKNDNNYSNITNTKIQYTNNDIMFSNIVNINNLDSLIEYDENLYNNIPESLNKYYQTYPIIDLSEKEVLNTIFNIININDLKKWYNNNNNKNNITINRVLDIAWVEYYNKIFIDKEFFFQIYINMYKPNNESDINFKEKLKKVFKDYNPKKKKTFSEFLVSII